MKAKEFLLILSLGLLLSGCNVSADNAENITPESTEPTTIMELQIDSAIEIQNADEEVEAMHIKDEDLSLFTPEDLIMLDNISKQDWTYVDDPSWILRFVDDVLVIGQEHGQITDILRYQITSIDHDTSSLIIHIVERLNEHTQAKEKVLELNYYCEIVINGDQLTYKNRLNDPVQMTETVWNRKH